MSPRRLRRSAIASAAVGCILTVFGVVDLALDLSGEPWGDLVFIAVGLAAIGMAFEIRYVSRRMERATGPSKG